MIPIISTLIYILSHTVLVSSTTIDSLIASLDDTLFTASSYQNPHIIDSYCAPYKSKYDIIEGCWCLETRDTTIYGEYLQINFDRQVKIYSVGTKGDPAGYNDVYVSSYLFAYSQDGNDFIYYNDAEILTGNMNYAIEQINNLTPPVIAQHVRFYPLTANGHTTMKVEAYGYDLSLTPTQFPTLHPIKPPSSETPSNDPTKVPSNNPTKNPSTNPSANPSWKPTANPSDNPTIIPSSNPTKEYKDAEVEKLQPSISSTHQSVDGNKPNSYDILAISLVVVVGTLLLVICAVLYCFYKYYSVVRKKKIQKEVKYIEDPKVNETGSNQLQLHQMKSTEKEDNDVNHVNNTAQHMENKPVKVDKVASIEKKEKSNEGVVGVLDNDNNSTHAPLQTKGESVHLNAMENHMIISDEIQNDFLVVGDDEFIECEAETVGNTGGN